MNRYQIAVDTHRRGFNCCAAVLFAFQDRTGLSDAQCYGLASGMGGGLRTGEVCGAVSGAVMVLGMLCPHDAETLAPGKERSMRLTQLLQRRFIEKQGAVCCRDLKPKQAQYVCPALRDIPASENCNHYILTAVELLEQIIREEAL